MKKIFIICLIGLIGSFSFGQKQMTLQESVAGQYQQFYPENVFNVEWIGNSNKYSYLEMYRSVMVTEDGKEGEKITDVWVINEKLGTSLFHLVGMKWKDENTLVISQGTSVVSYNVKTESGSAITLPENADNLTFDPTYTYIAYTKDNNLFYTGINEFNEVAVTQFEDKNIVSGQAIARSEMGITNGIFWSPSGNKLAFYQKDETNVHDYPLLNSEVTPGELKSIKYPMAGTGSEIPKLGIHSLKGKTTAMISPQNGKDYYLTNVAWSPDDKYILLAEVARSQKHIWMQRFTANGKFEKTLFEEKAVTWVEPEKPAYFPNANSNDFVWVSERDGFDNLYYYSIDGELKLQLTKNKFMLKEVISAQNGEVFFTATGENPLNTLLYKVNLKGKQILLTEEEGSHSVSINSTGQLIFDQYSSRDIPNRAVIRKSNGKILKEVLNAKNTLEEYAVTKAEIKVIKGKGGVDLYTRMIKPSNFDESKEYPVLIYVYGGPHAQLITNSWLDGASLWMHWMAEQGYIVFTLDNRGSGNRGVDFEHVIHRELGVAAYEDQLTGVEYLKSLPYIDGERIAVHGWSFGGYMTMFMMMNAPEVFKVGVAGGPVTDWKFYEVMYGERYMDTPEENPEGYEKTSLLNKADKLEGDLLMIHGAIDPVVVPQHAYAMIKKFVDAGVQTDFFIYPMHEHNVMGKDRIHLMEKVLNYVLENNK